ncbi:MAG: YkgJ family cysteine cluster protein [Candidatus Sericytochromatia bacterium]|nr:YkgJ family cysteine cluster protein [Candidatus Sericytochromatia bacterium]
MDVPLTHYDIKNIINSGTKIDLETFVNLYPSNQNDIDAVLLYGEFSTLYLTNKISDNSCLFLENNACSIYNFRPNSCRIWPFSKDEKNKLQIDDIADKLVSKSCDKKKFKDYKNTLIQVEQGINELLEFRELIKSWNIKVKSSLEDQTLENLIDHFF